MRHPADPREFGYDTEYDLERYPQEVRLIRIAPVGLEMIHDLVAGRVQGLPWSYR